MLKTNLGMLKTNLGMLKTNLYMFKTKTLGMFKIKPRYVKNQS